MSDGEFRNRPLGELKFADDGEPGIFSGYGAVFGNTDSYGDVIKAGAFKSSLRDWRGQKRLPPMLLQHGGGMFGGGSEDMNPIGIWTKMEEDTTGLRVEGKLALGTRRGAEAYQLLKMTPRPALDGLSIGFRAKEWEMGTKPEEPRRTLKKIELVEVSLVTLPANEQARVEAVKTAIESFQTERDFEQRLRDAGWSKSEAVAFVSRFKAVILSGSDSRKSGHSEWTDVLAGFGSITSAIKGGQ